jgi:lysophospholipase L1-like esterase
MSRDALRKAALAIVASLAALAVCEAVLAALPRGRQIRPYRLRLDDPNLAEPYLQPGSDVPYTTRPGYVGRWWGGEGAITIDARGFRVDGCGGGPPPTIDVLCLGDSFTFGYLVDDAETYPAALGRLYGPRGETVVNGGYVGGFSFDAAALRYERELAALRPRTVVYGVFPLNDFSEMGVWVGRTPAGSPERLRSVGQVLSASAYAVPLLRESRLFVGLAGAAAAWRYRAEIRQTEEERWTRAADAIRRFHAATASTGTRLVFVVLREGSESLAPRVSRDLHVSVAEYRDSTEALVGRLTAILDQEGVEHDDDGPLLAGLRESLARHRLPRLPEGLEELRPRLETLAERARWSPRVLAASDDAHYSALTNLYVAAWVAEVLERPVRRMASAPR